VLAEDGVVVDLVDGHARVVGAVPAGYVYVDGLAVGDVGENSLRDRLILGGDGFVSVVIVIDSVTGKVSAGPELLARGFSEDASAFEGVLPLVEEALAVSGREGVSDRHELEQRVRRVIGKWLSDNYRRRPMIVPIVIEV
jgi:ribonuclease J